MDSHTGRYGTFTEVSTFIRRDGRDPATDMVFIDGSAEAIERVSRAVAAHRPTRKARRKAQRAARKRNR